MLTLVAAPLSPFSIFDLSSRRSVVAAVSGGSDSTALLVLLKEHLDRSAPAARLVAVTIDHQLREDSTAEADAVARLCAMLGVEHRTLPWTAEKPRTGIPAAAREARYRLLAEAARDVQTDLVLTGHTADDQLETVAMRAARGDGRGLAGMAPATLYAGDVWILRPFLAARREALRRELHSRGVSWIDDPTNANTAFERPLMRKALMGSATGTDMLATIGRGGLERQALGERAARLIGAYASRPEPDCIRLDPAFSAHADQLAALYALRLLLATVGGSEQLPDRARSLALLAKLGAPGARATLSRCLIDIRRSGVLLRREARSGVKVAAQLHPAVTPFARFLPAFDLAPAAALSKLMGANAIPSPPFVEGTLSGHD